MVMAAVLAAGVPLISFFAAVEATGVLAAAACDVAGVDDVCIGAMAMASKAVNIKPGMDMPLSVKKRANEISAIVPRFKQRTATRNGVKTLMRIDVYRSIVIRKKRLQSLPARIAGIPTLKILMLA
jgi:hypothetical protein